MDKMEYDKLLKYLLNIYRMDDNLTVKEAIERLARRGTTDQRNVFSNLINTAKEQGVVLSAGDTRAIVNELIGKLDLECNKLETFYKLRSLYIGEGKSQQLRQLEIIYGKLPERPSYTDLTERIKVLSDLLREMDRSMAQT